MLNVAVFVSGTGSNLEALLSTKDRGFFLKEVNFVAVFSDKDSPPAFKYAEERNIPTFHRDPKAYKSKEEYEEEIFHILKSTNTDFICLAGYMMIVGKTLLKEYEKRIINIHPSLLPSFKGLHAQRQALERGVKYSGCTIHYVDRGVDTGEIIAQQTVPCIDGDTEETLSERILREEHKLYWQTLELISKGFSHE